jgi:hypothetical protein
MLKLFFIPFFFLLISCSGPSKEEVEIAGQACQTFIAENMGVPEENTKVFDSWKKKGAVVIDVGYKRYYSDDSYSMRLCVYDSKKGTISSPSPLNQGQWEK